MAKPYRQYILQLCFKHFYIEVCDEGEYAALVIERCSYKMYVTKEKKYCSDIMERFPIYGIMGTIGLINGRHLIVITKRRKMGSLLGHDVWKAVDFEFLPYIETMIDLDIFQAPQNRVYRNMICKMLESGGFYFSSDYDLTHTLQRLADTKPNFQDLSLFERADERFVWNRNMLEHMAAQPELRRFLLPVMHGFVAMRQCSINGKAFQWILISRRSCLRTGTRYFVRGIDSEGHAANFVETEQIVLYNGAKASFVQTRGSMPFFWSQKPNLKYNLKPIINPNRDHMPGFKRHFDTQLQTYGKQTILNLVSKKSEFPLEEKFSEMVSTMKSSRIKYIAFEFNKECRNMRWHRLERLIHKVYNMQDTYGYFMANAQKEVVLQQSGVFRSSGLDCVDETDIIQAMLARCSLQSQLTRLGVLKVDQKIEEQTTFENIYRYAWADNAHFLAGQYVGTEALKVHFLERDEINLLGRLEDCLRCLVRYIGNNFMDGFKQDSIDLFLGKYKVEEMDDRCPCNVFTMRNLKVSTLTLIMSVCFAMSYCALLGAGKTWSDKMYYVFCWGAAGAIFLAIIFFYGDEFVDKPKLSKKQQD